MVIALCDCNWGIPGVEKLPWHDHRVRHVLRRTKEPFDEIEFKQYHRQLDQEGWETVEEEDVVVFSIPWKQLVRGL